MASAVAKLLKKVSANTKEQALRRLGVGVANPGNGAELTAALETAIADRGLLQTLSLLDAGAFAKLCAAALPPDGAGKGVTKAAAMKRVADVVLLSDAAAAEPQKLAHFFASLEPALLAALAGALDVTGPATPAKVREAVDVIGAENVFALLETPLLREMCREAGLAEITDAHSKPQLVEALSTGVVPKAPEKKPKKTPAAAEKPSAVKPDIAKGISVRVAAVPTTLFCWSSNTHMLVQLIDLHTHYYVEEIRKYCKEHNIKASGNKKEMVKRILASFEGDKTVERGYKKPKKAAKKRAAPDAAATGDDKKKPAEKKPKKAEEAPAAPAPAPAPAPKKGK